MLNTALPVLYKDGTIADNTYQIIAEDGVVPQGDVVVTTVQLDQLANVQGKKSFVCDCERFTRRSYIPT